MRFLVMIRKIGNILGIFAVMALSACGGGSPLTLTQANLDKVQEGMTANEVKSILGNPTDSKTEPIPIVGGTKTTYVYSNKEDRVVVILKNDTVQSKEGHFVQAR